MSGEVGGKGGRSDLAMLWSMLFLLAEMGSFDIQEFRREKRHDHQLLHYRDKETEPQKG